MFTDQQMDRFLEHLDSISVSLHNLANSNEAIAVAHVRKMNRDEPLVPLTTEDHLSRATREMGSHKNLKAAATRFVDWIDTFQDAHAMQETGAYKYLRAALKFPVPEAPPVNPVEGDTIRFGGKESDKDKAPGRVWVPVEELDAVKREVERLKEDLFERKAKLAKALETAEQFRGERNELRVEREQSRHEHDQANAALKKSIEARENLKDKLGGLRVDLEKSAAHSVTLRQDLKKLLDEKNSKIQDLRGTLEARAADRDRGWKRANQFEGERNRAQDDVKVLSDDLDEANRKIKELEALTGRTIK